MSDAMDAAPPDSSQVPVGAPAMMDDWQRLPQRAKRVAMIAGALVGLIPVLPLSLVLGSVLDHPLLTSWWIGAVLVLVLPVLGALAAGWRWRRTLWKLDGIGLQVRRGVFWQDEILVPRSRVQHLDIERGPLERRFGLATLIVHTAGTRQHALRQSGLEDADAVALRDALVPDSTRHDDAL